MLRLVCLEEQNDRCTAGNNDCDRNARCIQHGTNDYICACPAGYRDKSPDQTRPGRVCIPRKLSTNCNAYCDCLALLGNLFCKCS